MDEDEARLILGVAVGGDEKELRAAHRRRIRDAHPDAGGTAREASRINEAVRVLRRAQGKTVSPVRPPSRPPAPSRPATPPPGDVDGYFLIDCPPDELLARLVEAGHVVGEVVFMDPHGGLLEIVVGEAPAVGQLAVTVGAVGPDGTPVSFTLDPLGVTPAPPIGEIVAALMAELGT